jgi:ribosomal-protein-alanine acetyltransferase
MIRNATFEDIPVILDLQKQTRELAHWSEQAYKAVFEPGAPERILLVDETKGALQAFLVARFTAAECELENIVVCREHRRRGIASQLLSQLIAAGRQRRAQRILLEVREFNGPARSLYRRAGFTENGRRKSYYANPSEDAVLYSLNL